jgi:hypothetical protein
MRSALAFVSILTIAAAIAADSASAQTGPQIVIPTRPGVPIYINGRDASYGVVEGDWGLERSVHVVPTVTYGPAAYAAEPPPVGHYYPSFGITPGYGRREVEPPANRKLPKHAESYSKTWSAQSAPTPAQIDPPVNPPAIIYAPQQGGGPQQSGPNPPNPPHH